MKRAIFLDRDGVINKIHYNEDIGLCTPHTEDEFVFMEKVPESIKKIKEMGFLAIVVGNQPDVLRGRLTALSHEKINSKMVSSLKSGGVGFDGVYYCFHTNESNCECRKPKPGMLIKASKDFDIDLKTSYIIGDTLADIGAGKAVGCTTILLANLRLDLLKFIKEKKCEPDHIVLNLNEAADLIKKVEEDI